jgi:Tfp pilus assembly protein PilF
MTLNQTRNPKLETRNLSWLIALVLIGITLAVFWPVGGHDFLSYDDPNYVTANRHVGEGLTLKGVLWAATTFHAANWHPVTWLSHMLDVSLFGLNPAGHHWMNLLFHLANVILLFFLLKRMTHALWPSALVAALFAIHPLHVESVAWIAERKDVLSAFFGLLTLWAYVGYVEKRVSGFRFHVSSLRPESRKAMLSYLAVLLFFTLSLMAKPMLVTLPFLMLLLDYWPLRRTSFKFQVSSFKFFNLKPETLKPETDFNQPGTRNQKPGTRNLFFEKLPLFALAAASSVITYLAQKEGESISPLDSTSLAGRIANALVSYIDYLVETFRPRGLAVFYPHPGDTLPLWQIVGSALLLFLISATAIRMGNRRPYLIVGWLWYLVALVPVIGIVQAGSQGMADRYTYLPLIGIFMMIAWGAAEINASGSWFPVSGLDPKLETRNLKPETFRTVFLGGIAGVTLVLLAAAARNQIGYWKNSVTLFEHALRAVPANYIAHSNLGAALLKDGRLDEAVDHTSRAIAIRPDLVSARNTLGVTLFRQGRTEEAIARFSEALALKPDDAAVHYNLGIALAAGGNQDGAKRHFSEAFRLKPDDPLLRYNVGIVYENLGRKTDAIGEFEAALRINPDFAEARAKLEGR